MPQDPLAAGDLALWLQATRAALACDGPMDVPCGECTACCRSAFFIHVRPDETESLSRIPSELLFPAPGLPPGHAVLGYDVNGRCPLMLDDRCSAYAYRPIACRAFDCRVFAATGVESDKPLIAEQVRRWEFGDSGGGSRVLVDALTSAASFIQEHPECFPEGVNCPNPTGVAIAAIKVYDLFVHSRECEGSDSIESESDRARAVREAVDRFDGGDVSAPHATRDLP